MYCEQLNGLLLKVSNLGINFTVIGLMACDRIKPTHRHILICMLQHESSMKETKVNLCVDITVKLRTYITVHCL